MRNPWISQGLKRCYCGCYELFYVRKDVCESRREVETPYWAINSSGELRAILNNKEFEQAVHQEICTQVTTVLKYFSANPKNILGQHPRSDAVATVSVSKSLNGIDCWLTIQMTTVREYSWTGFYFQHVALAGEHSIVSIGI